jgi:MFS family permease
MAVRGCPVTASLAAGSDQAVAMCRAGRTVNDCKLILVATILASTLAFLDGAVINVALPSIGNELHVSGASLQWLITGYLLPLGALQLLAGAMGDHYGHRRILALGIAAFTVASLWCALAATAPSLLLARILQGIGAALLLPNSLAVLGTSFDGARRAKAVGTWTAAGAIASAFGPPLAGWMVDEATWRLVFVLNIPLGLAALAMTWAKVPESSSDALPLDLPGTLVATLGLLGLTWAITHWSTRGLSEMALGSFIIALGSLAGLVAIERRRGLSAMIPLPMFTSATFVGLNLFTFFVYAAFGALFVLLPFVLIAAEGYSATAAGCALLPLPVVLGFASPYVSKLASTYGSRVALSSGAALAAAGYGLLLNVGAGSYWLHVFPGVLIIAIGMTVIVAPLTNAVLSSVSLSYTATAAGFNSAISRTGSLIAIAASGAVMMGATDSMLRAFHCATFVGLGLCALSAVLALLALPRATQGLA